MLLSYLFGSILLWTDVPFYTSGFSLVGEGGFPQLLENLSKSPLLSYGNWAIGNVKKIKILPAPFFFISVISCVFIMFFCVSDMQIYIFCFVFTLVSWILQQSLISTSGFTNGLSRHVARYKGFSPTTCCPLQSSWKDGRPYFGNLSHQVEPQVEPCTCSLPDFEFALLQYPFWFAIV